MVVRFLQNSSGMATYSDRTPRGVTLIEMLIVIVMIGILAGIASSRLDWVRYRADSVVRGLIGDLSQAQRTAVSLQMDVRVSVIGNDRIRIHEDANNNAAIDTGERVLYSVLDDGFRLGKGAMAGLPAPAEPTELTALVYRRDGSASRSGSLYISSPRPDPACKWCRGLAVTRVTGRVEGYSFATGTWVRNH
jgi:prepilin-type N-terminal cleavage/methylation domain-containing protein